MLASTIKTETLELLGDNINQLIFEDTDVIEGINMGLIEITKKLQMTEQTYSGSTSTAFIPIPATAISVLWVGTDLG